MQVAQRAQDKTFLQMQTWACTYLTDTDTGFDKALTCGVLLLSSTECVHESTHARPQCNMTVQPCHCDCQQCTASGKE